MVIVRMIVTVVWTIHTHEQVDTEELTRVRLNTMYSNPLSSVCKSTNFYSIRKLNKNK